MNFHQIVKPRIKEALAGLGIAASLAFTDQYFELSKQLEIFASMYKEVNTYYVDEIEPARFMRTGIDGMLKSLDPYTDFISESEIEDFRFITTGQYGGIGALVSNRDSVIVITDPYEGFPAQKAGILAGDYLLEVDDKKVGGKSTEDISKLLKGQPKTVVKLKIKRGTEPAKELILTREEISVKSVPYYEMLTPETGYIKYTGFKSQSGQEVAEAIKALKSRQMKKLILDLRDNPGGSLDEAIKISGFFIPKGSLIVDTKGKYKDWDKSYKTSEEPIDPQIPLVVLINEGSASASEIVSGVVQDYDRAVVMGVKSFGKGLVQTVRPLTYNTQLKVTTAKYYTPSGRCVQAINYSQKGRTTRPDSLKVAFKTKNGRTVFDGGGVSPDVEVKELETPLVLSALFEKRLLFDFATRFRLQNASLPNGKDFQVSHELFQDFKAFLKERKFDYQTESEKMLDNFKEKAKKENYYEAVKDELEKLTSSYHHDKGLDLDKHKAIVSLALREEIISRYLFQKGRIEASLSNDVQVKKAIELLSEPERYKQYLQRN